jgi:hypothetical protein
VKLEFITNEKVASWVPAPKPAAECVPDWFKELPGTLGPSEGWEVATAKKCASFLDGLQAGYMLALPVAIRATCVGGRVTMTWRSQDGLDSPPITMHAEGQLGEQHPQVFKFMTAYGVRLPAGCSFLLTHPLNRHDLPFRTFSGIIDDGYSNPLSVPFEWAAPDGEYYLEAGCPAAQLIPFVRADWEHDVTVVSDIELAKAQRIATSTVTGYRSTFHKKKIYK